MTDWLNRVCATEMDRPVGRIVYTTVLDHDGGVVCDLTVTRLEDDRYLLVTGGGSGPARRGLAAAASCPRAAACGCATSSSVAGVLGLWGPRARDVLARLESADRLALPVPDRAARSGSSTCPALALRISYAGELGWELYVPTEHGRYL